MIVSDLAVLDFQGPGHAMRIRSVHPGVTAAKVQEQTAFELAVAPNVHETAAPTADQLRLIREVLDPNSLRDGVFSEK
jgi:acyl CoA:acetate/3-ketoacid CoA transferase beta subunit